MRGEGGIEGSNTMGGGGGIIQWVTMLCMYNSRVLGICDSDLEKIFQNYTLKACFSSIFQ